jgi:hypothetical protein
VALNVTVEQAGKFIQTLSQIRSMPDAAGRGEVRKTKQ